jgi:predicted nucleotidyltransferase component of viral defense system
MDIRAAVECFHLYFSHRLAAKVDRTLFCLKGGCNLRFFFRSIRYSEDIDFDVHTISKDTLRKNVAHLLDDPSFRGPLHNQYAIQIAEWSAPKQTDTTQGWKVQLKVDQQSLTIPTKIEFSRRKTSFEGAAVEPIDSALIARNQMQPILLNHYQLSTAIDQKIQALIGRTET